MSGGTLPYHLRCNKAIDRSIFMELLIRINAYRKINEYCYIGFGALHMEDFKLVHSLFSITDMICIENNFVIYGRQIFNKPLGCIDLLFKSSGEFITDYFPEKNTIIWLDYTSPRQIGEQVREFQALISKLTRHDIIKITLNANPNCLVDGSNRHDLELLKEDRFEKLQGRLAGNLPQNITPNMMISSQLPNALLKVLEYSSKKALEGSPEMMFFPINSFKYNDSNHQMLTLTGILLDVDEEGDFKNEARLSDWEFMNNWDTPQLIDIPDLTLKERITIESLLPCEDPAMITDHIQIKFDDDDDESLEKMKNYIRYYRHYPIYSKVII